MNKFSFLIILFFASTVLPLHAKEFYVSPSGSASNTGATLRAARASDSNLGTTPESPFATIAHVRDAVRMFTQTNTNEDVTIWLEGGSYTLTETQKFVLSDGGAPGQKIIYSALPGQTPVFNSDVSITGWTKVTTTLTGLPTAAVGKVWVAPLPAALTDFKVMYHSAGFLPRASIKFVSQNDTTLTTNHYRQIELGKSITNPFYPSASNAEVSVIPSNNWTMNILPVAAFDQASGVVTLGAESSYGMTEPWAPSGGSVWVENTFAGMTKAGTWVLDKSARLVYYWPINNVSPGADVVAPALTELFRIEGTINYDGPTDIPVRGLVFRGLTFTHGDRYDASGRTGWGLQHDWERFDYSTAMVRFRGSQDCAIENCKFVTSGGAGVRFDLYAQNNTVSSSEFTNLGGTGILFAGYGPGTKDVNKNNLIDNNVIHGIGKLFWQTLGIHTWQSGWNTISRNKIYDVPYTGIALSGRIGFTTTNLVGEGARTCRWNEIGTLPNGLWTTREKYLHGRENIVTDNDISDVLKVIYDGNGIYISGTGKNNKICRNYVHDITSSHNGQAIRCDDDQHLVDVYDNIIFKSSLDGAMSKGDNTYRNNIIAYAGDPMVSMWAASDHTLDNANFVNNILITNKSTVTNFVGGQWLSTEYPLTPANNVTANKNIFFNYANYIAANAYLASSRAVGYELNSLQADPLFVDPLNGDFRFLPQSPALGLGIRELILNPGSTLTKTSQTITFGALASKIYGAANFALSSTANSGLPITYTSSDASVATISGSTVIIKGVGTTTITASQPGNVTYNAATSIAQVLTVLAPTGIVETENTNVGLQFYPNPVPVNGMLTMEIHNKEAQVVKIFNMNGQLVYSKNLNGKETLHLPISNILKAGIYNVTLVAKDAIINKKIIVN
ncbi:MAG: right-handed parallel beta-helix repeat-containing protein [Bacteroidia bacterium]|nr:right-handed parallel beta-helix repeat-containing protein [Bacteroidia bacterium]